MTIEGIVAMGVFFILMTLVVQLGFLVIARSAVSASLDASVRRSATPGASMLDQQRRLNEEITAIGPGLEVVASRIVFGRDGVMVGVTVEWRPPGPLLVPVRFTIERNHAKVVPP